MTMCKCGCGKEANKKDWFTGHWNRGRAAWNKGLTAEIDERVRFNIEKRNITVRKNGTFCGEKNPNYGKVAWNRGKTVLTDERVRDLGHKISKVLRGVCKSDVAIMNNRISHLGKIPWNKGISHSIQTKEKIRNRLREKNILTKYAQEGLLEKPILDNLEKALGFKIYRQTRFGRYYVDGFCSVLNMVFEVDEQSHYDIHGILKDEDIIRQKDIENNYRVKFTRIPIPRRLS